MSDCQHHFLLPPPSGPMVMGRCKHCGHEREHSSYEERAVRSPRKNRLYNGWVIRKAKETGDA